MTGPTILKPTRVDDEPEWILGTVAWFGENLFIYVKADGDIDDTEMCEIAADYGAQPLESATNAGILGVAVVDVGNGKHGWLQRRGAAALRARSQCAANAKLYSSATDGAVDDASGGQHEITGAWLTTARGANTGPAPCFLDDPRIVP